MAETTDRPAASTGRYAAPEREKPEFPRHRLHDEFADRSLPIVALRADDLSLGGGDLSLLPSIGEVLDPANVIGEVTMPELPANYFAPPSDIQTWLDSVLLECLREDASDVLLQTNESLTELTIDARVDNVMRPIRKLTGGDARIVMSKFRTAASLSTSTSYAPEETQYPLLVDGDKRKIRVASFRTSAGGAAVSMRLPSMGEVRKLNELGFSGTSLALIQQQLNTANGMILIAGPMGEGKTTTAHGALLHVNTPARTVWTIEDPVEREIPGLVQIEVDEDNQAGYDVLLPALVRSNYDTLFLGEIRDERTAAAGVRQAKAGRQVISTIHANNNITALLRLIDLAQDSPLSVMDSVRGVISQRLVGRLNPDWDGEDPLTRYKGRVPVHEILVIDNILAEAVMRGEPLRNLRSIADTTAKSSFKEELSRLIHEGITDKQEAMRVLGV